MDPRLCGSASMSHNLSNGDSTPPARAAPRRPSPRALRPVAVHRPPAFRTVTPARRAGANDDEAGLGDLLAVVAIGDGRVRAGRPVDNVPAYVRVRPFPRCRAGTRSWSSSRGPPQQGCRPPSGSCSTIRHWSRAAMRSLIGPSTGSKVTSFVMPAAVIRPALCRTAAWYQREFRSL
jgi:hypothetical protein